MPDTTAALPATNSVAAYIITLDPIVRIEADETGPVGWLYSTTGDAARLSEVIDLAGWEVASNLREVQRLLAAHAEALAVIR